MFKKRKVFALLMVAFLCVSTIFRSSVCSYDIKDDAERNIVLLLDVSPSMLTDNRINLMKESAIDFCKELLAIDNTKASVVSFCSYTRQVCPLTNDMDLIEKSINGLYSEGGTNIYDALAKANDILKEHKNEDNNIVLMTDGAPVLGPTSYNGNFKESDGSYYEFANACMDYVKENEFEQKYKLYTLGFVSNDDNSVAEKFLTALGYSGYYTTDNFKELTEYFKKLVQNINKYIKVYLYDVETLEEESSYKDEEYVDYIVSIRVENGNQSKAVYNVKVDCDNTILSVHGIPDSVYDTQKNNFNLSQTISKILPNTSEEIKVGFRISKRDFENGGMVPFVCTVSGDEIATIREKMEFYVNAWNKKDNSFISTADMWKTLNYKDTDEETDADMNAVLNEAYYHGISKPTEIAGLKDAMVRYGKKGHCYGLSLSSILEKMGVEKIRNKAKKKKLYDVKVDENQKFLIHFYQASQVFSSLRASEQKYINKYEKLTPDYKLRDLETAARNVKNGGTPVLLNMKWIYRDENKDDGYHAVVVYGDEIGTFIKNGKTYHKRLLTYDSNSRPSWANNSYKKYGKDDNYYIYYNKYSDGLCIPAYGNYDKTIAKVEIKSFYSDINDMNLRNPHSNYSSELMVNNRTSFLLNDSGNKWLLNKSDKTGNNVAEIMGNTKKLKYYFDSDMNENNNDSPMHVILPENEGEYKITTQSGQAEDVDFNLLYSDTYLSVKSELAEGAVMNSDNSITLKNNQGKFKVVLASNKIDENKFTIYTVSGDQSNNGDIVIHLTDKGIKLDGENIENIQIDAENKDKKDTIVIADKKTVEYVDSGDKLVNIKEKENVNTKEPVITKNESVPTKSKVVSTGDTTHIYAYITLTAVSIYALYMIKKWKLHQR